MELKKTMFLALAAFAALSVRSLTYEVRMSHADGVYAAGDSVPLTVTVLGTNGTKAVSGELEAVLDNFGSKMFSRRTVDLAKENPFIVTATRPDPGMVRLRLKAGKEPEFVWGVAFSPERIRTGSPRPADFDRFWAEAKAKYDREVPVDVKLEKLDALKKPKVNAYRISLTTPHGRTVDGILCEPEDLKRGPFPVRITVPGAGPSMGTTVRASTDWISLVMNVHYYPLVVGHHKHTKGNDELLALEKAETAACKARYRVNRYSYAGIAVSREEYHYYDCILAISRALDWLWARPEVKKDDFRYSGTSQGGGFGLILAGFNAHITRAAVYVPAITDLLGSLDDGRQSGWPRLVEGHPEDLKAAAAKNAPYFDAAHFAANIRIPIRVAVGLSDTVCAPGAVWAGFNAIPSEDKAIVPTPGMTHTVTKQVYADVGKWYEASDGPMQEGFVNPPREAKPHTWYHMMNGNVTKAGITRDFEELAKAGIGGVQMFDAGCGIPPGGLDFNSPEWFELFRHAASEARRLGLEICIPNCSGWSSSGGPWNPPSNGMKRVVFSETLLKGPRRFTGKLPRERNDNGYYEDIAVLAYPLPAAEARARPLPLPAVACAAGAPEDAAKRLADGRKDCVIRMDRFGGEKNVVTLTYPETVSASALEFQIVGGDHWSERFDIVVETSADGTSFAPVLEREIVLAQSGSRSMEIRSMPFGSARSFRALRATFKFRPGGRIPTFEIGELSPVSRRRIADLAAKTFAIRSPVVEDEQPTPADQLVEKGAVRDIGARMSADGTLDWEVPSGDWAVLRVGAVCNGRCNHPASDHGRGLEVDKLSAAAMDYHFEQYVARLCRTLGPLAGKVETGFNNILVDSYEVGPQNWTQGFVREFARRRGYDLRPYLPVFAGRVVGSTEESERFLEDFRRVVADLFAENYSGALAKKCREYGLLCSVEPYGNCPADNLQYGESVDIPMGEFWSNAANFCNVSAGNSRFPSYIAHVWGRRYCATESFTASPSATSGRWMTTPFSIKAQGDRVYASGVNRIVYHRFVHQPWADDRYLPGMTMGRWGMHLDRTQTWWPLAGGWFRYQARCQYMLQRGTFVADILVFAGEEAPNQGGNTDGGARPAFQGLGDYAYDVCPTDAMYALRVEGGELVVPGGVRYRVLALPSVKAMSPRMIRRVAELQRAGAKLIWGAKPVRAPGLQAGAAGDAEVRRIADEIFAAGVFGGTPAEALERMGVEPDVRVVTRAADGMAWIHRREAGVDWYFTAMPNRESMSAELSFRIRGRQPEIWDAETGTVEPAAVWREEGGRTFVTVPFNVCGSKFVVFRRPADPANALQVVREETKPFRLSPAGKVRIDPMPPWTLAAGADGRAELWASCPAKVTVKAKDGERTYEAKDVPEPVRVDGAWEVSFPHGFAPNRLAEPGPEEKVTFADLVDWAQSANEGIRYFSGTATYRKRVAYAARTGTRCWLELGQVKDFAEVKVNGVAYPPLWKPPFRVDVTEAVERGNGALDLEIRVTNLWPNRLIGDDIQFAPDCEWQGEVVRGVKEIGIKELPKWVKEGKKSPTGRHTFTTWKHWDKDDKLLPSGLLGPVFLLHQIQVDPMLDSVAD